MARFSRKNFFYRILWSIGHTPLRVLEFIQFLLLCWVLANTLAGFGGFLAYGEPMVGVSSSFLLLCGLHALMLGFRRDRPGLDPVLLLPVPFLAYAWVHFRFLSPTGWEAGALFAVYLQAYALFLLVYNSIHSIRSAKWLLSLLQVPILAGLVVAFLRFYIFPKWMLDPTRMPDPAYAHGGGGFLQDPANFGFFLIALFPLSMVFVAKHLRQGPGGVYFAALSVCLAAGLLVSVNPWGLAVSAGVLIALPFFTTGNWRYRWRIWKWTLISVPPLLALLWFGTQAMRDRLVYFLEGGQDPLGAASRLVGWRLFLDAPLLGGGLGSFAAYWPQFAPEGVEGTSLYVVSGLIDLLAEMGLVGFALAGLFIGTLFYRALRAWLALPYIRLNKEVAGRLENFPKGHPIHRRLQRDKGRMPTQKAALGSLLMAFLATLAYLGQDYSLKLPAAIFFVACMAALMAALTKGYDREPGKGPLRWVALFLPLVLAVAAFWVGGPRFYANHLSYLSSESLAEMLADPDRVFQDPGWLTETEANLLAATELVPSHGQAWSLLGSARLMHLEVQMENPVEIGREAVPILRQATALGGLNPVAHFNLARALLLTGEDPVAVRRELEMAAALAPGRVEPAALMAALDLLETAGDSAVLARMQALSNQHPDYGPLAAFLRQAEMLTASGSSVAARIGTPAALAAQFRQQPDPADRVHAAGLPRVKAPAVSEP